MEIYTRPRHLGEVPLGAILMLPLFGLPLGGWMLEHGHLEFGLCGMKAKFGLPCLSCGATRGTLRLFHGDPLGAIAFQPMMMLIYLILLVWGSLSLWGFVRGERVVIRLSDREDLALKLVVVLVPILNWIYLWQMGI
ncbi:MAG: DUF2752 domain-containing protein [Myxococcota bacterium]